MEDLKEFLESTTIHGLTYIATAKSIVSKFFWIIIMVLSFVTSIILIESLFSSWSANPVSTTVETKSISKSPFPRVSVCPPVNSLTSQNSDLKNAEHLNLTKDFKQQLANTGCPTKTFTLFKPVYLRRLILLRKSSVLKMKGYPLSKTQIQNFLIFLFLEILRE